MSLKPVHPSARDCYALVLAILQQTILPFPIPFPSQIVIFLIADGGMGGVIFSDMSSQLPRLSRRPHHRLLNARMHYGLTPSLDWTAKNLALLGDPGLA